MLGIINKKRYDTETAIEIATTDFRDGSNEYYNGRKDSLYRTKKGAFFIASFTQWQGEQDQIEVVEEAAALKYYEKAYNQIVDFKDAFPGVEVEDA